jgi:hypothetical protein
MKFIIHLDDHQCEVLRGGYWGNVFNVSMTTIARVPTRISQTNTATNTGLGLLAGLGVAQSMQGNASEVFSFVL